MTQRDHITPLAIMRVRDYGMGEELEKENGEKMVSGIVL